MPRDDRPFFRVHIGVTEHPKVEGLSDKAFRLLFELWAWCARNPEVDGHIEARIWAKKGTAKARRELIDAGLMESDLAGGVIVHDYDQWQRTNEEIRQAKEQARADGLFGAHKKWHVERRLKQRDCIHCYPIANPIAHPINGR